MTCTTGAPTDLATSLQYTEEWEWLGTVVNPIWLLMITCTVPEA